MVGMQIASGILAAGMVVAGTPCSHAADRAIAAAPAPALASQQPSETPASQRPSETDTPAVTQPLPNVKGKTFTSVIVYFPPDARAAPHRHGSAFVYAYVLEGTVRSQLAGEPVRTYHQGQNWVEQPGAHHVLTENTSPTKPAKLLVIFISDTGAKLKINDQPK
jgi:quercetin dioxygenase-like cupin family protein